MERIFKLISTEGFDLFAKIAAGNEETLFNVTHSAKLNGLYQELKAKNSELLDLLKENADIKRPIDYVNYFADKGWNVACMEGERYLLVKESEETNKTDNAEESAEVPEVTEVTKNGGAA